MYGTMKIMFLILETFMRFVAIVNEPGVDMFLEGIIEKHMLLMYSKNSNWDKPLEFEIYASILKPLGRVEGAVKRLDSRYRQLRRTIQKAKLGL